MKQPPLEDNQIQLTSKHRLQFEKMNIILSHIYQKRDGKGKNAPLLDEYDYNNPSYFGHPKVLVSRFVDAEFMVGLSDSEIAELRSFKEIIEHAVEHINKVKEEIYEHLTEHITIELDEEKKKVIKTVKGVKITE